MGFEKCFVCPCSTIIRDKYFPTFKIVRPIKYVKYDLTIILKYITELYSTSNLSVNIQLLLTTLIDIINFVFLVNDT